MNNSDFLDSYHKFLLSGMSNNLSNRENRLPSQVLSVLETNELDTIVVCSNIANTSRFLDYGFQEYNKIFDFYAYERTAFNRFVITIGENVYTVLVIDKTDFPLYFTRYSSFIDMTEYGILNEIDIQEHLLR